MSLWRDAFTLWRALMELVAEHAGHARHQSSILGSVDAWLTETATKLEDDTSEDAVFTGPQSLRAGTAVGELLNKQSEMGSQNSVHASA